MSTDYRRKDTPAPARVSIVPDPEMEPVAITSAAKDDEDLLNRFWVALLVAFLGVVGTMLTITGGNGGFQGVLVALLLHTVPGLAIGVVYRLRGLDLNLSCFAGRRAAPPRCSLPESPTSPPPPRGIAAPTLLHPATAAVWCPL